MPKPKKCLLLLNVGTPDSPEKSDVRKYLSQFLNDKYVIDVPWLFRKILVNGIIVPFRLKKSVRIYEQLWTKHGRILDTLTQSLCEKLQTHFGEEFSVKYAMRYGNPSIEKAVQEIKAEGYEELVLFPLFPQNAMSTITTATQEVRKVLDKEKVAIKTQIIPAFFNNPKFIAGLAQQAEKYNLDDYDHVLFSYHGLPNRHIRKAHKCIGRPLEKEQKCCTEKIFEPSHLGCYRAECYETSRLLAEYLQLPKEKYSIAFQSRLSKDWLQPFADETIAQLAKNGAKKLLVFTPSFTIDCLETLNEIGEEYAEDFYNLGGQQFDLVPCLNDSSAMVELVEHLVNKRL